MEIRLISSLTPDDENRLAPKVLAAVGHVLEGLPVSYSIRIVTAVGNAILQNRTAPQNGTAAGPDGPPDALASPAR
jgi:hypothetical protein